MGLSKTHKTGLWIGNKIPLLLRISTDGTHVAKLKYNYKEPFNRTNISSDICVGVISFPALTKISENRRPKS